MRKRTMSARAASLSVTLGLVLLVVSCDRESAGTEGVVTGADGADASPKLMVSRANVASVASAPPAAEAIDAGAPARDGAAVTLGNPLPTVDAAGAMLIRNGEASVRVARVDDAVARLRQTAGQLGGFVANTSIVGGREEHRSAQLEIRVPSARFDAAVAALGTLGTVESVSATVQDAGDEYVDMSARVANARHMEARLVEMLARRTGKLSEALTVEQELRRVREEIERYDARLRWLERKTALSSLQVSLHEPLSLLDQRGPSPISEAFAEAWRRAVGVVAWCIASLGVLIPLGVIVAAGYQVARRLPPLRRA